jgi:phosphinothricin acetyltransferase
MDGLLIRDAGGDDLEAINAIYNHYVLHSTATYQTAPESMADRLAWFAAHGDAHPITVAMAGGEVVGWGSLSHFHRRQAYQYTVENSVYVRHDLHRRGIGRAILADLIERARAARHHTIIAGIDGDQAASVALHAAMGFVKVGHLRQVGHKFGRWLDVIYMQRTLDDAR